LQLIHEHRLMQLRADNALLVRSSARHLGLRPQYVFLTIHPEPTLPRSPFLNSSGSTLTGPQCGASLGEEQRLVKLVRRRCGLVVRTNNNVPMTSTFHWEDHPSIEDGGDKL